MQIRGAEQRDDRALGVLDAGAWPASLQVAPPNPPDQPFFDTRRQPGDVIVAEDEGEILGYIRLGRHLNLPINDHVLHIEAVAVSPSGRGRGVGSGLVEAAIAEARQRGATKLGLRALSTNATAIRLYERHGFELEGRLRDEFRFADGTSADDLWFALVLT